MTVQLSVEDRILHQEVLHPGQMWSRVIRRGQALRLIDTEGGATPAGLFYNARQPLERYNMPDTLKAQRTSRLTKGFVLYSDMGRILFSVIDDTCGWHDTITGHLTAQLSAAKYGYGSYQELRNEFYRNTRDNFLIELGKHGLGKRDLSPNLNFFVKVVVDTDGNLSWVDHARAGAWVDLRAELDVLTVLSNTPHPLSPGNRYAPMAMKLVVWQGDAVGADDVCRKRCPENERGFRLSESYFV